MKCEISDQYMEEYYLINPTINDDGYKYINENFNIQKTTSLLKSYFKKIIPQI